MSERGSRQKICNCKCIISGLELAIALYGLVRLTDSSILQNLGFDFCENLADKICQFHLIFGNWVKESPTALYASH